MADPVANSYLVVSTTLTGTYYIGPFVDQPSAQTHADEHNKVANTAAVVETLVNPANC